MWYSVFHAHLLAGDAAENATGSTTPPPLDRIDSEETEQAETGAVSKMKNYALSKVRSRYSQLPLNRTHLYWPKISGYAGGPD